MTAIGADPEQLDALSRVIRTAANQLATSVSRVDRQFGAVAWKGADALGARSQWSGASGPQMRSVAAVLLDVAARISEEANEQRLASDASSASTGAVSIDTAQAGLLAAAAALGGLGLAAPSIDFDAFMEKASQLSGQVDFVKFIDEFGDVRAAKMFGGVGKAKLGPLSAAFIAYDTYKFKRALDSGTWDDQWRAGASVAWDVAGLVPIVGQAKTAWDVGWEVGQIIDNQFKISEHSSAHIVETQLQERYGGEPTPTQADEFAHRYDGVSGFGHFVTDGISSLWK